jgi:ferritin-like metal-binding protein YciE
MSRDSQDQFIHFLKDMYSVEQQALAQMVSAPDLAVDPGLAADFRRHHAETEQQAQRLHERLEAHGESPSVLQGAIMKLGGKGFLLFAALQPETPGRLTAHAYSYEAMEWAGYGMLIRFAREAGDTATEDVARTIRAQERSMMERLERDFDGAEQASHRDTPQEKMGADLRKHLAEAHALESQAITLLKKSEKIAGDVALAEICRQNLGAAEEHARLIEGRLEALGSSVSSLKDAAMAAFALNWGFFFQAQTDTPAKLAAFAYAFEHLKIAGYELLKRSAHRAGDAETVRLCEKLLSSEHTLVQRLEAVFDSSAGTTLDVVQSK